MDGKDAIAANIAAKRSLSPTVAQKSKRCLLVSPWPREERKREGRAKLLHPTLHRCH